MVGLLIVDLLAGEGRAEAGPGWYVPGEPDGLIPVPLRRDPERLLREAQRAGGGRESEEALLLALGWLARHQCRDGSWDVPDEHLRVEVAGLALLAFLSDRFTSCSPESGRSLRGY